MLFVMLCSLIVKLEFFKENLQFYVKKIKTEPKQKRKEENKGTHFLLFTRESSISM